MSPLQILIEARNATAAAIRQVRADLKAMESEAQAAGQATTAAAAEAEAAFIAASVAAAALTAGITITVTALTALAVAAISSSRELAETTQQVKALADFTGLPIDTLRGLSLEMERTGGSSAGLRIGLDRFRDAIVSNDTALAALGITQKDTFGALRQASVAFAGMADGPNKAAYANRLFGAAAHDWLPVLEQGAGVLDNAAQRANDMGLGLEKTATEAVRANAEMVELRQLVAGLGQDLTTLVLPYVRQFFELLNDLVTAFRSIPKAIENAKTSMIEFVKSLPGGKALVEFAHFVALFEKLARLAANGKNIGELPPSGAGKIDPGAPPPEHPDKPKPDRKPKPPTEFGPGNAEGMAQFMREALKEADKAARELEQHVQQLTNTMAQGFMRAFDGLISGAMNLRQAFVAVFRSMLKTLTDEIAKWLASKVVKSFLKIGAKFLGGFATGGFAGGIAAVFAPSGGDAPVLSGGSGPLNATGVGGGGTTNVYISTFNEKTLNDQVRSGSGMFNVHEYRERQRRGI